MNLVPGKNPQHGRLVLLAPSNAFIPESFTGVELSLDSHDFLLAEVQRLRGRIYYEDGAIHPSQLTSDGRYVQAADEHSWHIIALNQHNTVSGCARYQIHSGRSLYWQTGAAQSPLSRSIQWESNLKLAVESEIGLASRLGVDFVEVGGWALAPELRCTAEALRIALAAYSMARMLGGCVGLTTATRRHCSSSILRRIGGRPLRAGQLEIPSYYDPQYECDMEILGFNSAMPNPRFEPWIQGLMGYLSTIPVIQSSVYSDLLRDRFPATAA
jgi:hypothetical protein